MNPDKLFDYLDGKLSESDRATLERSLTADGQLQQQLAVAREIHRGMRGGREVMSPPFASPLPAGGARLGRRVAAACAVLVMVNVLIGIVVIARSHKNKPAEVTRREAAMRQQLLASLNRAAETALPPPTLTPNIINIPASADQRESTSATVIQTAERYGGSATKGLPDSRMVTLVITIPLMREAEFRQALIPFTGITPAENSASAPPSPTSPNETRLLEIRIGETSR